MKIVNKILGFLAGTLLVGVSVFAGGTLINHGPELLSQGTGLLGAVPSNGGLPGIYNATGTDLVLGDGYGSALAVDRYGRTILSPSSTFANLLPTADNTYDLGSLALRFRSGFFGTSVSSTIFIAGPGSAATPSYAVSAGSGFYRNGASAIGVTGNGTAMFNMDTDNFRPATGRNNLTDLGVTATRFRTLYLGTSQIFSSGATGIRLFNTADETTNYERVTMGWSSNIFVINAGEIGGTGTERSLSLRSGANNGLTVNFAANNKNSFNWSAGGANAAGVALVGAFSQSSGLAHAMLINPIINQSGTAGYNALLINPTESSTGSGAKNLIQAQVGSADKFLVDNNGKITLDATITAGGTTGARTINKPAGCVNFAAAATSLVVTNSLVSASSLVFPSVQTNDSTLKSVQAVPTSGSFTLYANAAATAETKVCFKVMN